MNEAEASELRTRAQILLIEWALAERVETVADQALDRAIGSGDHAAADRALADLNVATSARKHAERTLKTYARALVDRGATASDRAIDRAIATTGLVKQATIDAFVTFPPLPVVESYGAVPTQEQIDDAIAAGIDLGDLTKPASDGHAAVASAVANVAVAAQRIAEGSNRLTLVLTAEQWDLLTGESGGLEKGVAYAFLPNGTLVRDPRCLRADAICRGIAISTTQLEVGA